MELSVHIHRGQLLLEQGRWAEAEREFRACLAQEPNEPIAHAMLSFCLVEQERLDEATQEAQEAVRSAPYLSLGHRALAHVLHHRNRFDESLAAARQAAEIEPEDPEAFSLLASIQMSRRDWKAALADAERGLAIDAEHVGCQNLQAMALVNLGRRNEAGRSIGEALAKQPDNAFTHANQGWALLHQGKPEQAMEHFKEALRLDPNMEWARMGIVEALKSRNWVYRVMLLYFLWMSRLSHRAQWGIVMGGFVGYQVLRNLARSHPTWRNWLYPLMGLYIAFAAMTWVADPLFNLMLRLNRFGRLVLSRDQVVLSNWIGGLLVGAVALLIAGLLGLESGLIAGLYCALMIVPVSATLRAERGWPRRTMTWFTLVLAALGTGVAVIIELEARGRDVPASVGNLMIGLFVLGTIASPWLANAVLMSRPRR